MKKRPSSPSRSKAYRHASHIAWRDVEKEAVLLNVDTSEYYSLDIVGTIIWKRLGKGERPDKIARFLAADYGIPAARALKDTEGFIRDLVKEKLLQSA